MHYNEEKVYLTHVCTYTQNTGGGRVEGRKGRRKRGMKRVLFWIEYSRELSKIPDTNTDISEHLI